MMRIEERNVAGERNMQVMEIEGRVMPPSIDAMVENAKHATDFLKALAHEGRLMILCHLVGGEKSVTELEMLLGARQAAVSQQLARLRLEGLVACRREGKAIYYRLGDRKVEKLIGTLHEMFCEPDRA